MTQVARLGLRYGLLVVAVVILNFALPRFLPGDPLETESGNGMNSAASALTAEARRQLAAYYRLDRPLSEQFVAYLADLARGDLGWSISRGAPVAQLVAERLPWTLGLLLTAYTVAGIGGILLGLFAAWRPGRTSRALVSTTVGLAAIPEFLVAMGLLLVLAVGLGWFPLHGGRAAFGPTVSGIPGHAAAAADVLWHLALPTLTLAAVTTAGFVLLAHGALDDVRRAPYLQTARAKGLPESAVAIRHALPNALLPLGTFFGLRLGQALGGAIVVERIFAVPGLGLLAFEAIRTRDYPVLQAVFLLSSLGLLLATFAVELLCRRLDRNRDG